MMRLTTRLILCGALALLSATTATAGPIRDRLAARFARPTGGACQPTAAPVRYQPAPSPPGPQTGTVQLVSHATSYHPVAGGFDATAYQPIRLGAPLPVCGANGVCR